MTQSARKLATILEAVVLLIFLLNQVQCNDNDMRRARIMQFLSEPQPHFHYNRQPGPGLLPRIRSRSDNLPLLSNNHGPKKFLRSPQPATVQHIMRREQLANFPPNDQHRRYQFDQNQPGRFAHVKDAPVLDVGKNQFPPQYFSEQYIQNLKTSPRFNGNVIMKDHKPVYSPVQQHAIPVQASQYLHYPKLFGQQGASFSVVPSQQTALQNNQFPPDPNSYSVYEDSDNLPKQATNQGVNYRQAVPLAKESKEAQEYLQFMSTNEYFLPRRDPDFKKLDAERDQQKQLHLYPQQYNIQQQHQPQQQTQQQPQQQPQQHQQLQHQPQPQQHQAQKQHLSYKTAGPDNSVSSSYNEPIQVSDLFYQQDPAPANSAVVRGSYQAGQDVFVVKSDGNKAVKHVVSTPVAVQSSTQAPPKSHHLAKSQKSFTPEPLRFEFTEQDAIRGSMKYTQAPQANQYYYETVAQAVREPVKSPNQILDLSKPIKEYGDDPEDSADTENGKEHEDTKVPTGTGSATSDNPKDTESYCEKICANVYDENDEIICGSDGYMYTGETQLQCYSSCLNISVTIKSKGSCS